MTNNQKASKSAFVVHALKHYIDQISKISCLITLTFLQLRSAKFVQTEMWLFILAILDHPGKNHALKCLANEKNSSQVLEGVNDFNLIFTDCAIPAQQQERIDFCTVPARRGGVTASATSL